MEFRDLDHLRADAAALKGPVAVIACEDGFDVARTLRHHLDAGFANVVAVAAPGVDLRAPGDPRLHALRLAHRPEAMGVACANAMIDALAPGTWLAWLHNGEYLFTPFSETRRVGEACAFAAEERRDAMLSTVVDLYPGAMPEDAHRFVARPDDAWLDAAGYFALARDGEGGPKERQLDLFGGLRWRFEEHVPPARRRIDRVSLFRVRDGVRLRADGTLTDEEMNTYACPWHHSMTCAVASYRAAKALATNPGSRAAIEKFAYAGSVRFRWTSRELMDRGFMEPGQWF